MTSNTVSSIDEYILKYPPKTKLLLEQLRYTIQKAAPDATETINYGMPTFKLKGNLVHFAAYKNHIGFYPTPSGIENFKKELATYKSSKGAVQFPLNEKLPLQLIENIVRFRVRENLD